MHSKSYYRSKYLHVGKHKRTKNTHTKGKMRTMSNAGSVPAVVKGRLSIRIPAFAQYYYFYKGIPTKPIPAASCSKMRYKIAVKCILQAWQDSSTRVSRNVPFLSKDKKHVPNDTRIQCSRRNVSVSEWQPADASIGTHYSCWAKFNLLKEPTPSSNPCTCATFDSFWRRSIWYARIFVRRRLSEPCSTK